MKLAHLTSEHLAQIPKRIIGYKVDDGYWHTSVWLFGENNECIQFKSFETTLTDCLEVYSLTVASCPEVPEEWDKLDTIFEVDRISFLWRDEWAEKGATQPTLGSDPCTVFSDKMDIDPSDAIASATLLSGIKITSKEEQSIVINSSTRAPLNVDFIQDKDQVAELLKTHTELKEIG